MFGMLEGVEVIVPEQVDAIHEAYMQTVNGASEGRERLRRIAHELPVDAIVSAGTDLSLVFDESNIDFPYVDCTRCTFARSRKRWPDQKPSHTYAEN